MRFDAHVHGMHADRDAATGKLVPPVRPSWTGQITPEAHIQSARDGGVEGVLVLDPPEVAFELKAIFGDFVEIAPQLDLDVMTPQLIDEWFHRGACGVKFIAPMRPYGDDAYMPLYDAVCAHQGLAVFHTGYLGSGLFEPGCFLERSSVADITHMRPATINRIARTFPDLKILMAHFGNPWWDETKTVIRANKNVYADFSGGTCKSCDWTQWQRLFAPNGQLDAQAIGSLCFATDASLFDPGCFSRDASAMRLHDFYDAFYERLNVPEELRARIDSGNIRSLIGKS